ncbi:MAG: Flp pilus assembly protein CpaB [Candidatus Eremiobacteraeota bacterium]|nr:Flp pilus assembly protein CpaB [Candidatus Eremiobacteraeota bacterium]
MIIAVVVAVAAGLLTVRFLAGVDHSAQPTVAESKPVLIASVDIHAREKITPAMLTKTTKPVTQIEPGALADPHAAEGDLALVEIREGSTITDSEVGQPAQVGITAKLRPGMRAVSIPMDLVKSVSGLVEPGDRVDVMASLVHGNKNPPTRTIIRGALVLAVNTDLEPNPEPSSQPGGGPPSGPSAPEVVTLAVTPDQADLLTFADFNTTLRLALRSPNEPVRSYGAEPLEMPTDTPAAPPPANVAPPSNAVPPPAAPAPAPTMPVHKPSGITVIEGDEIVGATH